MKVTSSVRRVAPPHVAGERQALTAWLDYHRATLLGRLEGLDDEQLRRPMVPSGVCLLGLVKHPTAVEHGWFVVNFARSGEMDLRWLLVHMIEETARHNGHADVIRELLDGTTGD